MSTRTHAVRPGPSQHGRMLWSDRFDQPPKEMRASLAMLRRLGWLLPLTVLVAVVLVITR
jgi:hypothetical protein